MPSMLALVKEGPSVALREVPRPEPMRDDDVLMRVALAGLCRTDLAVAEGKLASRDPVVLGHELSGVVEAVGWQVRRVEAGARVTVDPIIPCDRCALCAEGSHAHCAAPEMLGVQRHGAFSEYVVVPERALHVLPSNVSFQAGAYVEPIAASLAVLDAGIRPGQKGLFIGRNRIAQLTQRILAAHGFGEVPMHEPGSAPLPENAFDFVIETVATSETMALMLRAVRPQGTVVLKSRQHQPVALDVALAVRKELVLRGVHYGPFPQAIALLAEGRLQVDDLFGETFALPDHARAFAAARSSEALKIFLRASDLR